MVLYSLVSIWYLLECASGDPLNDHVADGVGLPVKSTGMTMLIPALSCCGTRKRPSYSSLGLPVETKLRNVISSIVHVCFLT